MIDPIFNNLLIHICDIQTAVIEAASDDSYGHETPSFGPPATVKQNVPCRLEPMSADEQAKLNIVGSYQLYLAPNGLPQGLNMQQGSASHQIVNVRRRKTQQVFDAGPFDITSVVNTAGVDHHIVLLLNRVTASH